MSRILPIGAALSLWAGAGLWMTVVAPMVTVRLLERAMADKRNTALDAAGHGSCD